ncbi:uncharacterized protein UV8b_08123 [Ustilaginoidea virens]|uniref:Myb-like DNA-binding domain-containing protein n=1 Tax=Ustilaginoidea virens TaxID=1159556 RepID=A0A063C7Z7_USTVR|nr:uncharacterized protein UV8b_08123 [Ustilaginoidea virens]QUC23882.1 hypothetical protein UV8b_08123 [Ustilaginoidea virens]GAO14257.1 hypothetical protein UVI_02001120 [Ustilaginoidea virens]
MSPNGDNAMARFLFAILKQKNLKDIDWNQVAQDPVLLQPISNGHAARMRYSRFRATVTGHEPQRRNRHGEKDRVSKSSSRKEDSSKKGGIIKSESGVSLASLTQFSPAFHSPPYSTDYEDLKTRFLTPCSDDMTLAMSVNPAALEDRQHQKSGAYSSTMDCHSDLFTDPGSLTHSPAFPAFDAAYELDGFSAHPAELNGPNLSDLSGTRCAPEWNEDFHDPQLF